MDPFHLGIGKSLQPEIKTVLFQPIDDLISFFQSNFSHKKIEFEISKSCDFQNVVCHISINRIGKKC